MEKWADYCISKLSLKDGFIEKIVVCSDHGVALGNDVEERTRDWLVSQVTNGKTFCTIKKNKVGSWNSLGKGSYDGSLFSWYPVPESLSKRKAFISYYHKDDEEYREYFDKLFDDLVTSKSVNDGDINPDNSDEYTKMLIQSEYLHDTTILIVLVGAKTKCRKHVDWEISGALDYKVGDKHSALLGIILPSHPDFGTGKYTPHLLPQRLHENVKSGYAVLIDWTEDRKKLQDNIEKAISKRNIEDKIINRSIPQMTKNECE